MKRSRLMQPADQPGNKKAGAFRPGFFFLLCHKMIVTDLHIRLQRFRIAERRLNTGVSQEPLDLLQRHPALKGKGRGGVAENMRSDMDSNFAPEHNLLDLVLHRLDGQTVVRSPAANK